jgi:hypothetical protein
MKAVGIAEQESGRAVGFFCGKCGRSQLPAFCQNPVEVDALTELHRKAEACCTTSVCEKHDYQLYGWHLCPHCVAEGPEGEKQAGDGVDGHLLAQAAKRTRTRKAAAK